MTAGRQDLRVVDEWAGGTGWIAHPGERLQRASHAVERENGAWLLDPVDAAELDRLLADIGPVVGVVVCLDRHLRDATRIARRHGVPVFVADWMDRAAETLERDGVPVERFGDRIAGFDTIRVKDRALPPWRELALTDGRTLYVPEAVGTTAFFCAPGERLGVHPLLRPVPPRRELSGHSPKRLLVGHGEGVFDDPTRALRAALADARRQMPAAYAEALRELARPMMPDIGELFGRR